MSVVELPVVRRKPGLTARIPEVREQKRIESAGNGPFAPILQGALGVVRGSASLLFHVAAFGVVLVSGPKTSLPARSAPQARRAYDPSNVVAFPSSKAGSTGSQ